jgi:hypothetical protein
MKNQLLSKSIIIIFILTTGIFNVYATENEPLLEEYVPELMNDGSVVFNKKSDSETEAEPVIKLRSATVHCCKAIKVGQNVLNICKNIAGTKCPAGTKQK